MKDFNKLNTVILGVSADPVTLQAKFKERYKLNFPLLSDPEFKTIESYNARRMKSFLGRSFLGIVRSSTLIGPDGRIERLWPAVKAKGHAAEVLAEVKELAGQTPNS
jgi:peroxiredoxin Q/BCP